MAVTGEWMELPPSLEARAPLKLLGELGEMTLDHVGIAVRDVDEAVARFGREIGIHDWMRSTFATTSVYKGEDQRIGGHVATASMGFLNIELVQPTDGAWTPVDVLKTKGEGLYHLGFRVPDVAESSRRMKDAGMRVSLLGTHGETPLFIYSESDDLFGVCIELVGPRMPAGMITAAVPIP